MSFFESITKKSRLKTAIKLTTEARSSEGSKADQLFKKVYQDYAEVVSNEPLIAEALYNWGLALLHQARTKRGDEAARLYQDAIAKFSFCLTLEPAYLGAALDGGVAYMELARVKAVPPTDSLYGRAQNYFEKANAIQAGSASYNLACIYGLRGDKEGCLNALEISRNKGYLPVAADIFADPDMSGVIYLDWFVDFMDTLNKEPEPVVEIKEAAIEEAAPTEKADVVEEVVVVAEAVNEEADVIEDDSVENAVVDDAPIAEKVEVGSGQDAAESEEVDAVSNDDAAVNDSEVVIEHKALADEDAPVAEKTEVAAEAGVAAQGFKLY